MLEVPGRRLRGDTTALGHLHQNGGNAINTSAPPLRQSTAPRTLTAFLPGFQQSQTLLTTPLNHFSTPALQLLSSLALGFLPHALGLLLRHGSLAFHTRAAPHCLKSPPYASLRIDHGVRSGAGAPPRGTRASPSPRSVTSLELFNYFCTCDDFQVFKFAVLTVQCC
jgi:hypothetical protein